MIKNVVGQIWLIFQNHVTICHLVSSHLPRITWNLITWDYWPKVWLTWVGWFIFTTYRWTLFYQSWRDWWSGSFYIKNSLLETKYGRVCNDVSSLSGCQNTYFVGAIKLEIMSVRWKCQFLNLCLPKNKINKQYMYKHIVVLALTMWPDWLQVDIFMFYS